MRSQLPFLGGLIGFNQSESVKKRTVAKFLNVLMNSIQSFNSIFIGFETYDQLWFSNFLITEIIIMEVTFFKVYANRISYIRQTLIYLNF